MAPPKCVKCGAVGVHLTEADWIARDTSKFHIGPMCDPDFDSVVVLAQKYAGLPSVPTPPAGAPSGGP